MTLDPLRHRAARLFAGGVATILLIFCSGVRADDSPPNPASGATTPNAAAAQNKPQDLTQLGIEDLMKIQVTTASRQAQPLSAVPAAVFVITQEDIRRSGVTSIPEALRMAPGVEVARIDANKWAISIRGFNDRFADKLLVLIDGRSVYTPLFSGVFWDAQDTVIEDIDRIEVIRGPGGALWGANAVNGIINIITKNAKDAQGSLLALGAGNVERGTFTYRYGAKSSPDAYYRVYAKYFSRADSLYEDGTRGKDGWDSLRGGFRFDWDRKPGESLLFSGELDGSVEGQRSNFPTLTAPYSVTVDQKFPVADWHLLSRWTRRFQSGSETSLQMFYDRSQREIPEIQETRDTFDIDFQHRAALRHNSTFVGGLGFRNTAATTSGSFANSYSAPNTSDNVFSAFVHLETPVRPNVRLTIGSRFEHNDYTGFEVQPNARLAWTPDEHHTLWAAVSRAVRTPSQTDQLGSLVASVAPDPTSGLPVVYNLLGNPAFVSERVISHELGYRFDAGPRLVFDLAAFYNEYDDLRSFEAGSPSFAASPVPHIELPILFSNMVYGKTHGFELASRWTVSKQWNLALAYTYFESHINLNPASTDPFGKDADGRDSTPRHQVNLRSHLSLPHRFEFELDAYFVDSLVYGSTPQYQRVDMRLGWKPNKQTEVSIGGRNLFGAPHREFTQTLFEVPALVERNVYGKLTMRF